MIKIDKDTVTFNNQRWYDIGDGVYYPSITTILGATDPQDKIDSLNAWRKSIGEAEADRITTFACERGTVMHDLIENHLLGKNSISFKPKNEIEEVRIFSIQKTFTESKQNRPNWFGNRVVVRQIGNSW